MLAVSGVVPVRLPWSDPDFQVSGATVLIYLAWSLAGSRCACGARSAVRLSLYAVLLVSSVDSFVARLTLVHGLFPLRWLGAAALAAGCVLTVLPGRAGGRLGTILQCAGLALGLGSLAGTACAAMAAVVILGSAEHAVTGDGEEGE